ncbi:unnamed protein product [Calypogeia fissa]
MHRELWRRWMRTSFARKEWNGAESRWSNRRRHESCGEMHTKLSPESDNAVLDHRGGSRHGLPWIARGGTVATVDWRNANLEYHGWKIGVMSAISVRHFAAPLSRTGKPMQNPARQQRPDPDAPPEPEKPERKINRAIVSRTIRLITREGHQILTRAEALRHAENMDLDLVEVDGKQDPPVCKLMDFNKERFKEKQREKEHKKKQSERRRLDDLKEVRFSTRTEQNDLELKAQMALRLLTKGHRVKLAVIPHGNDELEPKGRELLDRMITLLQDSAKVEIGPRIERQRAWTLIRPTSVASKGSLTKTKERKAMRESVDTSASDSEDD